MAAFFRLRPVTARGGFRLVVNHLYYDADRPASGGFSFDADILLQALRNIYAKKGKEPTYIEANLLREFCRSLDLAVTEGFQPADPDDNFYRALRHADEVFAAFKVHRTQRDMAARLIDSNGNLKPFEQWQKDVQPIASHQCGAWLRTEYDTAIIRAHQAADWQQFEQERDVLPNLKWMPSTSPNPGADHRIFWGTIRPIDDPFWKQHRPGDRWNCKCSLSSTDEPATDVPTGIPSASQPQPGLTGNPGQDRAVFSQDHPYFPSSCRNCDFYKPSVKDRLRFLFLDRVKDCYNCPYINGCIDKALAREIHGYDKKKWEHSYNSKNADGYVMTEKERIEEAKTSKNEKAKFKKEFNMCRVIADNGHKVEYLHGVNRTPGETYDITIDGTPAELKATSSHNNIEKYAKKAYREQGAQAIVFELGKRTSDIYEALNEAKRKYPAISLYFYFTDDKILRSM